MIDGEITKPSEPNSNILIIYMMTDDKTDQACPIPTEISPFSLDDLFKHLSRILSLDADQISNIVKSTDNLTISKATSETVSDR